MIKRSYKPLVCMLIWMQILSCVCFAEPVKQGSKKEHLSPKISLSNDSLKRSINAYSEARVESALLTTAKNITSIGQRNFKRELSPRELLVALAMILEGKTFKHIDGHFDSLNYLLEEFGIKRKPKQIKTIRIIRGISVFFFAVSFTFGLIMLDIIKERYHIGHLISVPVFLFFAWYFIGWVVDFFSWAEKKIDPRNKHIFDDTIKDLNKQEKKEFFKKIEQTMRDLINNRFDEPDETVTKSNSTYTYEPDDKSKVLDLIQPIYPVIGSIQLSQLVFSAI